jgi:hypothetical protein
VPVKTDRKYARGIAELMLCKSVEAQETRAMLTAPKLVQRKRCATRNPDESELVTRNPDWSVELRLR